VVLKMNQCLIELGLDSGQPLRVVGFRGHGVTPRVGEVCTGFR
jgi:hypothetical protein